MQARHAARELALIVFSQCPENISKLDSGDSYTTLWIYQKIPNCNTLKRVILRYISFISIKLFFEKKERWINWKP